MAGHSVFQQYGLHIAYPEGWRADAESDPGEARVAVTISGPETAFWTLAQYAGLLDLEDIASQALEALRSEYPDLEPTEVRGSVHGAPLVGYDVNFVCLDLTNTAVVRATHSGGSTLLMLAQAEDREFIEVQRVFEAMLASALASGAPAAVEDPAADPPHAAHDPLSAPLLAPLSRRQRFFRG